MDRDKKIQKIVDYIRSGEKDIDVFKLGFEVEHFVVDKDTFKTVSYYGENGTRESMEELADLGFGAVREDGDILGLTGPGVDISIEPASQFELAIRAQDSVDELLSIYKETLLKILPVFEKKNQALVCLGYHPKTKIDDIKIIPKKRYEYMYNYFDKFGGKNAHNMMKGTCSLQFAVDYENEDDFKKKYRLASALSPFLYTVFDNSYIFEGEPYGKRNLRQTIWENCDRERTGLYDFSFDVDYRKYAENILDTPMIFVNDGNEDVYVGRKTLGELMDEDNYEKLIDHGLSIVFPDVRAKKYIEIRMPDNVPYPYNMSALALIKGIFFREDIFNKIYDLLADMDYEDAQALKLRAKEDGLKAIYKGKKISDWVLDIINIIRDVLDPLENKYLDDLESLVSYDLTPRDIFERIYKEDPKRALHEFSVNGFLGKIDG